MTIYSPLIFALVLIAPTDTIDLTQLTATRHLDINERRGFSLLPRIIAKPESKAIPLPEGSSDIEIEITAESVGNATNALASKLKTPPTWGLALSDSNGSRYSIAISTTESDDYGFGTSQAIKATVSSANGESHAVTTIGNRASIGNPERISLKNLNGNWQMTFTSDKTFTLPIIPIPSGFSPDSIAITTDADILTLRSLSVTRQPEPSRLATCWSDTDLLDLYIKKSSDPIEGYWHLYDFTIEQSLLRIGGDYRLAIVRQLDTYLIIYLNGAKTEASQWHTGMIKGQMRPTPFPDIYMLTWLDASFRPMSHHLKAVSSADSNILTIDLPYQQSTFRLRKLPTP